MQLKIGVAVFMSFVIVASAALELGPLEIPSGIQGGVTTNAPISVWHSGKREFNLSLSLNASPTNSVVVSLGKDEDCDGKLSAAEIGIALGWDCGKWVLDHAGFDASLAVVADNLPERKSLSFSVQLDSLGNPAGVTIGSDGTDIFEMDGQPLPRWIFSKDWNMARLDTRGVEPQCEHLTVRYFNNGLQVHFR